MAKRSSNHSKVGGSNPLAPLQSSHEREIAEARERFKDNPAALLAVDRFEREPSKCFQRHLREVRGEQESHEPMLSMEGATVKLVTNKEAAAFIGRYEWLGDMGAGTMYSIGGFINDEMFGVECFGKIGKGIGSICRGQTEEESIFFDARTLYLMRGACAPWAYKKAASWLIKNACRFLYDHKRSQIFFAYSDAAAGEVGIVYQRAHWKYLGTGLGKSKNAFHADYVKDGHPESPLTSYKINHGRLELALKLGGPTEKGKFRPWLEMNGWTLIKRMSHDKGKYVWFEGNPEEIRYMRERCLLRFGLADFVKYPIRNQGSTNAIQLQNGRG